MISGDTGDLSEILKMTKIEGIENYFCENETALAEAEKAFSNYFKYLLRRKGLKEQEVFLAADVPEGYGYKLMSEEKHTRQRDVILRLTLAAGLSLAETNRCLKLYSMTPLYPRIRRDAVIIVAIQEGLRDPAEVNRLLAEKQQSELYLCR